MQDLDTLAGGVKIRAVRDAEIQKFYDDVGDLIAEARKARKPPLTQEELAARTGSLSRSAIANIESHRQRVALHQLLDLADALGLPPSDLLPTTRLELGGPSPALDDDAEAFISALRDKRSTLLSKEDR